MLISQIIIPFWVEFVCNGHFVWTKRVFFSFVAILKLLTFKILMVVIVFVLYLILFSSSNHGFSDFKNLAIKMLNSLYYLVYLVCFGHGLLRLPRISFKMVLSSSLRLKKEKILANLYVSLHDYAEKHSELSRNVSILRILKNIHFNYLDEEFKAISKVLNESQTFCGFDDAKMREKPEYCNRASFSSKDAIIWHGKLKELNYRCQHDRSRFYYLLSVYFSILKTSKSKKGLVKVNTGNKLEEQILENQIDDSSCVKMINTNIVFSTENISKKTKMFRILLLILSVFFSCTIIFLEILEFFFPDTLSEMIYKLWNPTTIIHLIFTLLFILSTGLFVLLTVYTCMFYFNLGKLSGLRLNKRTDLLSLISLSRWLSLFTFPICFDIFHKFLTQYQYKRTNFYTSLKRSDFIQIKGIPLPFLVFPFLIVIIVFFSTELHSKLCNKLGYFLYGLKPSKFPPLTESELGYLLSSINQFESKQSLISSKVFFNIQLSPKTHSTEIIFHQ